MNGQSAKLKGLVFLMAFGVGLLWVESSLASTDVREKYWRAFVDGRGEPISGARVEIFGTDEDGCEVFLGEGLLDEAGRLATPDFLGPPWKYSLVVSHPDYGIGLATSVPYEGFQGALRTYYVPVVSRESAVHDRCIRGVVVGPEGAAVEGARITCRAVRGPGGFRIDAASPGMTVLSNSEGSFRMYLPVRRGIRAVSVPRHAEYEIAVDPPVGKGLVFYWGVVASGRDVTIKLKRAPYWHTFSFEDDNGVITDSKKMRTIRVCVGCEDYNRWYIRHCELKDGCFLPLGSLRAEMVIAGEPFSKTVWFEPLEVTKESPEHLIFRLIKEPKPFDITYVGRVVHGVTGEPMAGAFVVAGDSTRRDLSVLGAGRWKLLHNLPSDPCLENPVLKPVRMVLPFAKAVRTDADGRFEIKVKNTRRFDFVVAFEKDFVCVRHYVERDIKDFTSESTLQIPTMQLYPAAKVVIEPVIGEPKVRVIAGWVFSDKEVRPWCVRLASQCISTRQFMRNHFLQPGESCRMYVPADVDVRLRLEVVRSLTWDDREWIDILTEPIRAAQGEVINLGQIKFDGKLPVFVEVVDSSGHGMEGVAVSIVCTDGTVESPHITDSEGIAMFLLQPNRVGHFAANLKQSRGDSAVGLVEAIPFEIKGPNDANSVYTLKVSDETAEKMLR